MLPSVWMLILVVVVPVPSHLLTQNNSSINPERWRGSGEEHQGIDYFRRKYSCHQANSTKLWNFQEHKQEETTYVEMRKRFRNSENAAIFQLSGSNNITIARNIIISSSADWPKIRNFQEHKQEETTYVEMRKRFRNSENAAIFQLSGSNNITIARNIIISSSADWPKINNWSEFYWCRPVQPSSFKTTLIVYFGEEKTQFSCSRRKASLNTTSKDSPPELVYTFIDQAVQPGGHVALKCSAAGNPEPRFKWLLDGEPLPPHLGAIVSDGSESSGYAISSLVLNGARVEHGGRYQCQATNKHGTVSHSARVNVYGAPYIRAMSPVRAVSGSDVTILCPYYGFPISSVRWERGGSVLSDGRYQQSDGQLVISGVVRDRDAGTWYCSVTSPGGELARREIQVLVVSPPVLSPLSVPSGLRSGDRTQLTCTVTSGDMPVYFSWLKDQLPISSALQVSEKREEFLSMLMFKSLTAAHNGIYSCVATNSAGKANTSIELAVKVPPYWTLEPSDVAVLLGGSVTVNCEAKGYPMPTIYWTKLAGESEAALGGVGDSLVLSNGSLRIDSARGSHSGRYRCRADNGVQPSLSKTLTIHINEPARFEMPSANVTSKLGDTVRLVCIARGDSPLTTSWSHGGRTLLSSDYRMSVSETKNSEGLRSELIIERADRRDSGLYRCQASNPYGRSDHFINLSVQEPPEPPTNFRVSETTSRSIRVSWRRPYDGNSPVQGYVLQYRRHDPALASLADPWADAETKNVTIASLQGDSYTESDETVIPGLQPATTYAIRARTVTSQFASAYTRSLLAATLHEPPSRGPLNPRAAATKPAAISLTWQAPPTPSLNGELLGYTVWWWVSADEATGPVAGAGASMEYTTLRDPNANSYTIEGLEHYTRYSVSLRAFNRAGASPASAPITAITQESVPGEGPRAVRCRPVSPQSLKVEWSPPPAHAHRGILIGYKLLYRPAHAIGLSWDYGILNNNPLFGGAEVKRVTGVETLLLALRPNTNYTVQAVAYTTAGDGVPSPVIHCTTLQDVPGPPASVKVVPSSATSITVSWLPPDRPNGQILFYTVYYRELGRDRETQNLRIQAGDGANSNDSGVGLGGVCEIRANEGSAYETWVAAHSPIGEGEPSPPHPITTTHRVGARIISFGVRAVTTCSASIQLACAWRGEMGAKPRWLRHQRPFMPHPRISIAPGGQLVIHEVDASTIGNYTCAVRNPFGNDEITYKVECVTVPTAPALNVDRIDHTSAKLFWRIHSHPNAPVHGFTVSWSKVNEAGEIGIEDGVLEVGGESSGTSILGLACGSTYSVSVIAHSRAGSSPPSNVLTIKTKAPVLSNEDGESVDKSSAVWSNSSAIAVDIRRCVLCGRLVRLQWRPAHFTYSSQTWKDAPPHVPHHYEVMIAGLEPASWYALRLWTASGSSRYQATLYAATRTLRGERIERPAAFPVEGQSSGTLGGGGVTATDRMIPISYGFACLAALTVTAFVVVILARRSIWLWCGPREEEEQLRRRSQSAASTDKSICADAQNMRNCQHDYKHDKLSPQSDVYEISPYATFAVGGVSTTSSCGVEPATLDHSLQFRTFGLPDNEEPVKPPHCRKHPHRHREVVEKHSSDCELQQLSRYEKARRHGPGPSYCVPLPHRGSASVQGAFSEVYAGDSSVESGPGSMSPRTADHS